MKPRLVAVLLLAVVAAGCGSRPAARDGEIARLGGGWKTDLRRHTVPLAEFEPGGPGKDWHEIVNDRVGGTPVAVTFCPLCNTAIAFDRRVDGRTLSFGTTGNLRNSDLVMYDRRTESWWQQPFWFAVAAFRPGVKVVR